MPHFRRLFVLSSLVTAAGGSAVEHGHAQIAIPDSVQHRNDCRLAGQILLHGQPAAKRAWALAVLPSCCGAGAAVAVQLLHRMETYAPEEAEELITALAGLVDRNLALAATDLATNAGAAPRTRVNALRVLYAQAAPGFPISYARITRSTVPPESADSAALSFPTEQPDESVIDIPVAVASELTHTDIQAIAVRLEALSADAEATEEVRAAAGRVSRQLRSLEACPRGTSVAECLSRLRARHP